MQSKIDRSDLHAIALQIANGELEGLHPAVAAKLQIPDFRCLCCDRPLPSSAVLSTSSVSLPGASMTPASSANCLHALPKQLPHLDANSEDLYSRDDTHANKPNRADAEPHRRQRSAPTHPQYVMDESVTATVAPATNADSQSLFLDTNLPRVGNFFQSSRTRAFDASRLFENPHFSLEFLFRLFFSPKTPSFSSKFEKATALLKRHREKRANRSTFSRYPRLMPPKHLKPATKYRLN